MSVIGPSNKQLNFSQQLLNLISHFSSYENPLNLAAAFNYTPVELIEIAEAKYSSCPVGGIDDKTLKGSRENIVRDLLLLELLRWFKEDFFQWMDTPKCPNCSKSTQLIPGSGVPTAEERRNSASRVEVYTCSGCCPGVEIARFPRYNDPVVLLKTRTGRCGEWANCFALICCANGFEVRHVTDWTDHVWVEVFSSAQNRWLHCDPCENKCDQPLLYELGWGKNLSYVIAISADDIQDVTWRYSHSRNLKVVLSRRNLVDEAWLLNTILKLRKIRQQSISSERRQILQDRLVKELVEFICPTKDDLKDAELGERESGSLVWKLARHEIRREGIDSTGFVWELTKDMVSKFGKNIELFYDVVRDEYFVNRSKQTLRKGWANGLFELNNISRKEEHDWKMVYIARHENQGGMTGKFSWKFEISKVGCKVIDSIEIQIPCATFHSSASIVIEMLTSNGERKAVPDSFYDNGICKIIFRLKPEVTWIVISCHMRGGEGSACWQQTQVFREPVQPVQNSAVGISLQPFITLHLTELPRD